MNNCRIHGCGIRVEDRALMCEHHWAVVPKPVKAAYTRCYTADLGAHALTVMSLRCLLSVYDAIEDETHSSLLVDAIGHTVRSMLRPGSPDLSMSSEEVVIRLDAYLCLSRPARAA